MQTSENIVSPPPIEREYFVRWKSAENIKQKPAMANMVKNAPRLNSKISEKLIAKAFPPTIQTAITLTTVRSANIEKSAKRR